MARIIQNWMLSYIIQNLMTRIIQNWMIVYIIPKLMIWIIQNWMIIVDNRERGTWNGMEVMWFHTGNYTEMMQDVTINGSFPAQTLYNSTAIFCRPSSLSLKKHLDRSREVFPLEPVKRSPSLRLTSWSETLECKWVCPTSRDYTYMYKSCKVGIPRLYLCQRDLGCTWALFAWMKSPAESLSDQVTSH